MTNNAINSYQDAAQFCQNLYGASIFSEDAINRIKENIFTRDGKRYLKCLKRGKDIQARHEEIIRQLMLDKLIEEYKYPVGLLDVEYSVSFGREKKLADIVILNKADKTSVYCVVEVKKQKEKDGKEQLKSYTNATGSPLAIWTNGTRIEHYERLDPNHFEHLTDIPKANQTIDDVKEKKFTYLDLMKKDKLRNTRSSLEEIIKGLEDEVLANAGVDVFEEVFKLIFTKLYDELSSFGDIQNILNETNKLRKQNPKISEDDTLDKIDDDEFRPLEFRSKGDAHHNREIIEGLFGRAKKKWPGIFDDEEKIKIMDENHLRIAVSYLQDVKIYNSNLFVIDKAFEYLISKTAKGEKGQYFTPRNVIDMCVYMLNPKKNEFMIDPACGSSGFTVHTLANVWEKIKTGKHLFQAQFLGHELTAEQREYINNVFGIDFDEKSVKVARTLNMIAGDGNIHVLHMNALDYPRWEKNKEERKWLKTYNAGYQRLLDHATDDKNPQEFDFDIVMANPPFAGNIKDSRLLGEYDIVFNEKRKKADSISRDILFIERNLSLLKPGGRMAIILPQGRFNNVSDERIRDFIMERARLLAVVGLDVNTFKPHTGTKTSVLFVQKWDENTNPPMDDYPIFMAVSQCTGKDNSGEEIYEMTEDGQRKLDEHGHLVQEHDLKEIAKSFRKWAKENKLNFWQAS